MFPQVRELRRAAACGIAVAALLVPTAMTRAQERAEPTAVQPAAPTPSPTALPASKTARGATQKAVPEKVAEKPAILQAKLLGPVDTPAAVDEQAKSFWSDLPQYRKTPRPGFFYVPPTGCGYYSLSDFLAGDVRQGPPKIGSPNYDPKTGNSAYPAFILMATPFYDADFRYVDDPNYDPDFLERLHRIHVGENWLFGTGGQASWRYMHETSSRLTGKNNDYDLVRARIFGDVWYKDVFRVYAEFVTANTLGQTLAPLRIDEDRADMQNLFFDAKIGELDGKSAYVRVGRQELLFGSQRLISPPDWANTRRTFDGVRAFWSNDKFDVDLFWVRPVIPVNTGWSWHDNNQNFYGAWVTYRPAPKQAIDLYYLLLDNENTTKTLGLSLTPAHTHTLGSRYSGDKNGFLWDFEGMMQFGDRGGEPIRAGSVSAGAGYNAKDLPMNPTVWGYYDWASGDHTPNSGNFSTFNQLFPFGHYYFGWLDLVGRQNIRDWNMHLYLNPAKWVTFNAQYHFFNLDSARDALYNAAGTPIRASLSGAAGGNVGQEIDLIANFHLSNRSDLLIGWSKLNAGDFIRNTGNGRSPELLYTMYNVRW